MENEYTPKNNWNNWNWNGNQMYFLSKKHDINKIYPGPSCFTSAVAPRLFRKKSQFSLLKASKEVQPSLFTMCICIWRALWRSKISTFRDPTAGKNAANGQSCA